MCLINGQAFWISLSLKLFCELDEQEEDILDRFLKVKKFADNRVASYESKLKNTIRGRHFSDLMMPQNHWTLYPTLYDIIQF